MTAEKAAELCRYIDVETWRITYLHQHTRSYIYLLSVSNDIMLYSITVGAQTEGFFNIYIYIYIYSLQPADLNETHTQTYTVQ